MKSYKELLDTDEWKYFSYEVLKRDNFICRICHRKGFQNDLFIPIPSLSEALDMFEKYRFDGKMIKDVIKNTKQELTYKKYYFESIPNHPDLFRPKIEKLSEQTDYQYKKECMSYGDILFYSDTAPKDSICFYNSLLLDTICMKVSNCNNINSCEYYSGIMITHFHRTSDIESGYINIRNYEKIQHIRIVTNEYYILLEFHQNENSSHIFPRLNVHHTFYYYGNIVPWGYYWEDLITLCEECHGLLHKKEEIPIYDTSLKKINDELELCNRCKGTGFLPQYRHVQNGICFKCRGTKKIFTK
jgi:hypothetical protein